MNKLDQLFAAKKKNVLNIYCTAGFPALDSTASVMLSLQQHGADIIELGIPYSDPIADGPVIQHSNAVALHNGISMQTIFAQLETVKKQMKVPVVLMGYLNPVLQYGVEQFCDDAAAAGVSGVILPDMPMHEYETMYQPFFSKNNLHVIFLVSPLTSTHRIKKADKLSSGFLYAVSASATTGADTNPAMQEAYFHKLKKMKLQNPVLIGFGIKDKASFDLACASASGAIIGTAYIRAIENAADINAATAAFISSIKNA